MPFRQFFIDSFYWFQLPPPPPTWWLHPQLFEFQLILWFIFFVSFSCINPNPSINLWFLANDMKKIYTFPPFSANIISKNDDLLWKNQIEKSFDQFPELHQVMSPRLRQVRPRFSSAGSRHQPSDIMDVLFTIKYIILKTTTDPTIWPTRWSSIPPSSSSTSCEDFPNTRSGCWLEHRSATGPSRIHWSFKRKKMVSISKCTHTHTLSEWSKL